MKTGRHFVVVKKLDTKTVDGSIVSNEFDIKEIEKTLGNAIVDEDASQIKYEGDNVFLILVCKIKSVSSGNLGQIASNFR